MNRLFKKCDILLSCFCLITMSIASVTQAAEDISIKNKSTHEHAKTQKKWRFRFILSNHLNNSLQVYQDKNAKSLVLRMGESGVLAFRDINVESHPQEITIESMDAYLRIGDGEYALAPFHRFRIAIRGIRDSESGVTFNVTPLQLESHSINNARGHAINTTSIQRDNNQQVFTFIFEATYCPIESVVNCSTNPIQNTIKASTSSAKTDVSLWAWINKHIK